ncbi:MAG: ABC transporter ATPase [Bacteroidetes bacterium]|nr:MAG: ABC transporter ATPase [Bacteroidota bacterium]MBL1144722.1 ABC transporter ATPase [Bacteroidota bacterium]MCB0802791.1 ABC transporter ATPase [Flavobacteriales bacterium]NOG57516.1 ABC transporter ATPase [Bacteroidota bacterium]
MDYKDLSDHSKVWIYQSNRKLTDDEVSEIKNYGKKFIDTWSAHGSELNAAFEIFYNQFIVLFADETQVKTSGCSIDASTRFIKDIQNAYRLDLFDRMNIAFMAGNKVDTLRMTDFQNSIAAKRITENTIVFNNLVNNKKDFMNAWKVPLKDSWHKQLL